jgi:hypothetical protein
MTFEQTEPRVKKKFRIKTKEIVCPHPKASLRFTGLNSVQTHEMYYCPICDIHKLIQRKPPAIIEKEYE